MPFMSARNEKHTNIPMHEQDRLLRKREERLAGIMQNIADAIITIDVEGTIESFNPAAEKTFGHAVDEVVGKNVRILMTEPHRGRHDGYIQSYLRSGKGKIVGSGPREVVGLRKDGRTFPMDLTIGTLGLGQDMLFIGVARDITERKVAESRGRRLEQQLRQIQKMESLGAFAAGIAHEFNNMLLPIIGLTELTMERVPEGSCSHENLGRVLQCAKRAGALVDKILSFSRRDDPERKLVDLRHVLEEQMEMFVATVPATIEIYLEICDQAVTVPADKTQLHQVVVNLVSNSVHAMGGKVGALTIGLSLVNFQDPRNCDQLGLAAGAYAKLSVQDTGHGMDKETLDRIFEPFFTTKDVGDGTGMGLAMIHGIITGHGGAVDVSSEPGAGTTFKIYLPLVEQTELPKAGNTQNGRGQ